MKKFLLLIFLWSSIQAQCQSIAPESQPYFSAVVVKKLASPLNGINLYLVLR